MSLGNNLKAYLVCNLTRKMVEYLGARNRNEAIRMCLNHHQEGPQGAYALSNYHWLGSDKITCSRPLECLHGKLRPLVGSKKRRLNASIRNEETAKDAGLIVKEKRRSVCFRKPEHAEEYLASKMKG